MKDDSQITICPGETKINGLLMSVCPLRQLCSQYNRLGFKEGDNRYIPFIKQEAWCDSFKSLNDFEDAFEVQEWEVIDIGWSHKLPTTINIPNWALLIKYVNTNTSPVKQIFELIMSQDELKDYMYRKGYKVFWSSQFAFLAFLRRQEFIDDIIEDAVNQFMFAEVP